MSIPMFRSRIKKLLTSILGDRKDTWRNYYIPMSRCRNNLLMIYLISEWI